ncbi:hypothetical protein AC578_2356 [Pseudocercospora eumusae]|uniref:Uncharacterized protein n=1 Tax=Pseudocercospora eumusae TaxID=321146 RepID=A0A139HXE3_9PEZI|nr:hypothetical protein AC578_2356 [Pseudocercospora eumusae]
MLVPSSFKYSSASMDRHKDTSRRRSSRGSTQISSNSIRQSSPRRPLSPVRTTSEPVPIRPPKSPNVAVASRDRSDSHQQSMPSSQGSATLPIGTRKRSTHDPNALPPAVAALLAVTSIPPRRPNRYRTKPGAHRRISIEELVSEWKSDESFKTSYGSSGSQALSVLLEDVDYAEEHSRKESEPNYLNARSASSESMPSLDSDDRSILSLGSPSTPESLRSNRSYTNLKKEKSRSLPASESCAFDHPLLPRSEPDDEDDLLLPITKKTPPAAKQKSSFKSNLTASLQSLKEAAVNSISSLARSGPTSSSFPRHAGAPIDDMLWSHPFLFPRFSSEIRPATDCTPSSAERRYLNPMPLTFEEQEAPFQEALHAPFLAESTDDAPTIQLQTYTRGRRRANGKRAGPNPSSEAGRALLGAAGVRQREVRENSDFLRVVVLEMNMRREGKLEQGRAKIWLPPRQACAATTQTGRVPPRWVGESA